MKVEYVILGDAAHVYDGKLSILGGAFTYVRTPSFPAIHPMAIAITIGFDPKEAGVPHTFELTIADAAGVPVVPVTQLQVAVGPGEVPDVDLRATLALNAQVPLQKPGRYTVSVKAGDTVGTASFVAVLLGPQVTLPPQPSAPPPKPPPIGRRR